VGLGQFCRRFLPVQQALLSAIAGDSAVILKTPSTLSGLIDPFLRVRGRPYGLEVVGDAWDVFAPGALRHPLRGVLRAWFDHRSRVQCTGACAVSYVTSGALQRRYPARPGALAIHRSDVHLAPWWFVDTPRELRSEAFCRLITVGSLEHLHKGPDVLIEAFSMCVAEGLDAELVIVGDGKLRRSLEALAENLRVAKRVRFLGSLPAGEAIARQLDASDLFVLPSRADALPRSLIEAMARGLPCIGSTTGGIPELLPPECLIPPADPRALKEKILEMVGNPALRRRQASMARTRALDFAPQILAEQTRLFHSRVRDAAAEWRRRRA
jgi:glycosyltransferase involved in cell wall biosynthesis